MTLRTQATTSSFLTKDTENIVEEIVYESAKIKVDEGPIVVELQ